LRREGKGNRLPKSRDNVKFSSNQRRVRAVSYSDKKLVGEGKPILMFLFGPMQERERERERERRERRERGSEIERVT